MDYIPKKCLVFTLNVFQNFFSDVWFVKYMSFEPKQQQ